MTMNEYEIKRIVGNKDNAINVLTGLNTSYSFKELTKFKSNEIYNLLYENFDYEMFHTTVRLMALKSKYSTKRFLEESEKYKRCIEIIETEFKNDKKWGFHPSSYEDYLIKCIRKYSSIDEARIENLKNSDKNLVIKSYNNARSFLFEYFLVRNKQNILPTLSNSKGLDIFLDKKWDIKNTSGVTSEFKKDFGEKWKEVALKNPKTVAEYLFKNQGEDRFNCDDRIFIIDLSDSYKNVNEIDNICKNMNFNEVYDISFEKIINGIKNNCSAKAMVVFI